jgi:hypothetical protein
MMRKKVSTEDKPLAFFEYFFGQGGFQAYKRDFFDIQGYEQLHPEIDKENETVTTDWEFIIENNEGTRELDIVRVTKSFPDSLTSLLESKYQEAIRCIDKRFDRTKSPMEVSHKKKLLLWRLEKITELLASNSEAARYPVIQAICDRLKEYILDAFGQLIKQSRSLSGSSEQQHDNGRIGDLQPPINVPQSSGTITAFFWTDQSERRSLLLHSHLIEKDFIDPGTELIHFTKAFSGEELSEPLEIKWIKKKKGKYTKLMIFCLFDALADSGLIHQPVRDVDLYTKLDRIFIQGDGSPFKHWKNSLSSNKRAIEKRKRGTPPEEEELIAIAKLIEEETVNHSTEIA